MQVLVPWPSPPEVYQASKGERRMRPPPSCPNCRSKRRLRLLGYYERDVSSQESGEAIRIKIRRFRCRDCRLTTSLLPAFCLPYRLVRATATGRYLRGHGIEACELRWQHLLIRYKKRFENWLPKLRQVISEPLNLQLNESNTSLIWQSIEASLGQIDSATALLVDRFRITFLGEYECHSPRSFVEPTKDDHRHLLFSSGTDPPK